METATLQQELTSLKNKVAELNSELYAIHSILFSLSKKENPSRVQTINKLYNDFSRNLQDTYGKCIESMLKIARSENPKDNRFILYAVSKGSGYTPNPPDRNIGVFIFEIDTIITSGSGYIRATNTVDSIRICPTIDANDSKKLRLYKNITNGSNYFYFSQVTDLDNIKIYSKSYWDKHREEILEKATNEVMEVINSLNNKIK